MNAVPVSFSRASSLLQKALTDWHSGLPPDGGLIVSTNLGWLISIRHLSD
jgi:hypothetical protein